MGNIKIDSGLIPLLGRTLYQSEHSIILVRELLQNALDACDACGRVPAVRVNLVSDSSYTTVTVEDNGIGMDEHTLLDVFLTIGASYKPTGGVGGFGIAKVALFSCLDWRLWTNDLYIDSTDLDIKHVPARTGTKIVARIYRISSLESQLIEFIVNKSNREGIHYNRVKVHPYQASTVKEIERDFTVGITRTREPSRVIYRIGGLVQFADILYDTHGYHILVDFDGIGYRPRDDSYPFTISREELRGSVDGRVSDIVDAINTDKLSNNSAGSAGKGKKSSPAADRPEYRYKVVAGVHYRYYKRGFHYNLDDKRLVKVWRRVLRLINSGLDFKVGLADDPESAAFLVREDSGVLVFYINPVYTHPRCTSTDTTIAVLWHLACHESAHLSGSYHNEVFTCKEAELANNSAQAVFSDNRLKDTIRYYREQLTAALLIRKAVL